MPVCKWQIEPRNLICGDGTRNSSHYPADFTDISNEICSNIVRQLSSLSKHVQDLFRELNTQASDICLRSLRLNSKVDDLKERCNRLNPTIDKVSLDDIIHCKPFKSGLQKLQLHEMGRPEIIAEAYSKLDPIPDIHLLNRFKGENEVDCIKLYSDPNFFFLSWCGQIKQEVDKKPSRKKAPATKKAEVTRKPQNVNLRRIQDRMKNEIIGGVSKKTSQERFSDVEIKETSYERHSQLSNLSKSSTPSTQNKAHPSVENEMTDINQDVSLPPPPHDLLMNTTDEDVDFTLPPPPVEPEKRGTLYIVEDFKPDFLILPEPPPEHILHSQPQHFLHIDEFPELPSTIPPLPPPLPVDLEVKMNQETKTETPKTFADMISSNAFKLTSSSSQDKNPQMGRQSSSGKGDSRNELLSAIKNGIKLRKVDEVRQEVKDNNQEGMAGMFDVQMIMEMRRRALQDEDEDDDDDDGSECSWDE